MLSIVPFILLAMFILLSILSYNIYNAPRRPEECPAIKKFAQNKGVEFTMMNVSIRECYPCSYVHLIFVISNSLASYILIFSVSIIQKVDVNGINAHPVYHYVKKVAGPVSCC